MSEYTPLRGKFYCEVCHTSFERGRDAIQIHERSQKHKRAKEKNDKWNQFTRKKEKTEEEKYEEEVKYLNERNQRRYTGAEPPKKDAKPAAGQKPGAPKTNKPGPPGGPGGDSGYGDRSDSTTFNKELGLTFRPSEQGTFGNTWTVAKDEETGKLCFYNRIAGTKHFERPRGVKLSEADEKTWEEYQENPTADVDVLLNPEIAEGNIGGWEAVEPAEDYYAMNAIESVSPVPKENDENEEERLLDEKLDRLDELNEEEVEELLNLDKPELGKSLLKAKTDKLKKLIDTDMEAVAKPVFKKDSDILYKRTVEERGIDENEDDKNKGNKLFKKRKVQSSNRTLLGFEGDLGENKDQ